MESKIEIADLVKPKFLPEDMVYVVRRDCNGQVDSVKHVMIVQVRFTVKFRTSISSREQLRETDLAYDLSSKDVAYEEDLFATLGEIKERA